MESAFLSLSFSLHILMCVYISLFLAFCVYVCIYVSVCLSLCVCLSVCMTLFLSFSLCIPLPPSPPTSRHSIAELYTSFEINILRSSETWCLEPAVWFSVSSSQGSVFLPEKRDNNVVNFMDQNSKCTCGKTGSQQSCGCQHQLVPILPWAGCSDTAYSAYSLLAGRLLPSPRPTQFTVC